MSKPARVLAVTAVINIIFIAIVVWFLVLNKTIVPLYGIGLNRKLDLSFLAMPLIGYFSLQLLSELVDVALTGALAAPIRKGLDSLQVTAPLYFLLASDVFPAWSRVPALALLVASILFMLEGVGDVYLGDVNRLAPVAVRTSTALLIGVTCYILVTGNMETLPEVLPGFRPALPGIILITTFAASLASALGGLREVANPHLVSVGNLAEGSTRQTATYVLAVSTYAMVLRPYLGGLLSLDPRVFMFVEWLGLCVTVYYLYRLYRNSMVHSLQVEDIRGGWRRHIQEINVNTDRTQTRLEGEIDAFLMKGEKKHLLTYLTLLMRSSQQPDAITMALAPLHEYSDLSTPRLGFKWQTEAYRSRNVQRRLETLDKVLTNLPYEHSSTVDTLDKEATHAEH